MPEEEYVAVYREDTTGIKGRKTDAASWNEPISTKAEKQATPKPPAKPAAKSAKPAAHAKPLLRKQPVELQPWSDTPEGVEQRKKRAELLL